MTAALKVLSGHLRGVKLRPIRAAKQWATVDGRRRELSQWRDDACAHGKKLTEHCPWCYVQTSEYKDSLAQTLRRRIG